MEFRSVPCPVTGACVWIRRFENGQPVCSYLVPGTAKDIRVGSFLMSDARVALDNVVIRTATLKKK